MYESEGNILKKYLKTEKLSMAALGRELDMTAQGINYQTKQSNIDIGFKHKMAAIGRDLFKVGIKSLPGKSVDRDYEKMKMELHYQGIRIQELREMADILKEKSDSDTLTITLLKEERRKYLQKKTPA